MNPTEWRGRLGRGYWSPPRSFIVAAVPIGCFPTPANRCLRLGELVRLGIPALDETTVLENDPAGGLSHFQDTQGCPMCGKIQHLPHTFSPRSKEPWKGLSKPRKRPVDVQIGPSRLQQNEQNHRHQKDQREEYQAT